MLISPLAEESESVLPASISLVRSTSPSAEILTAPPTFKVFSASVPIAVSLTITSPPALVEIVKSEIVFMSPLTTTPSEPAVKVTSVASRSPLTIRPVPPLTIKSPVPERIVPLTKFTAPAPDISISALKVTPASDAIFAATDRSLPAPTVIKPGAVILVDVKSPSTFTS